MTIDPHALSPRRTALGFATLVGGLALAGGTVIGVAAGVGAVWHATNPPGAAPARAAAAAAASPGQAAVHLVIENVPTPQGSEPAFVGPNGAGKPDLFTAKVGVATEVTIVNKTDVPHSFTSSALGLNVSVPPGPATVHFTLDAKKAGEAQWACDVPCGAWVMANNGYMQGSVEVVQ